MIPDRSNTVIIFPNVAKETRYLLELLQNCMSDRQYKVFKNKYRFFYLKKSGQYFYDFANMINSKEVLYDLLENELTDCHIEYFK